MKNAWRIVKERRKMFLKTTSSCDDYTGTIVSDSHISDNIDNIIEKLTSDTIMSTSFDDVSEETLETAAKMFTYLNFCPNELFSFYADLFLNASPKEIMLALRSINKASITAAHKISSTKIFDRFTSISKLTHYKDIEKLALTGFPENCKSKAGSCNEIINLMGNLNCNLHILIQIVTLTLF